MQQPKIERFSQKRGSLSDQIANLNESLIKGNRPLEKISGLKIEINEIQTNKEHPRILKKLMFKITVIMKRRIMKEMKLLSIELLKNHLKIRMKMRSKNLKPYIRNPLDLVSLKIM